MRAQTGAGAGLPSRQPLAREDTELAQPLRLVFVLDAFGDELGAELGLALPMLTETAADA